MSFRAVPCFPVMGLLGVLCSVFTRSVGCLYRRTRTWWHILRYFERHDKPSEPFSPPLSPSAALPGVRVIQTESAWRGLQARRKAFKFPILPLAFTLLSAWVGIRALLGS